MRSKFFKSLFNYSLKLVGLNVERVYYVVSSLVLVTVGCPGLFGRNYLLILENNGLHHLTECAVAEYHSGNTVFIGKIEGVGNESYHLLNGSGSENEHVRVAVTGRTGRLKIV